MAVGYSPCLTLGHYFLTSIYKKTSGASHRAIAETVSHKTSNYTCFFKIKNTCVYFFHIFILNSGKNEHKINFDN